MIGLTVSNAAQRFKRTSAARSPRLTAAKCLNARTGGPSQWEVRNENSTAGLVTVEVGSLQDKSSVNEQLEHPCKS
jgi:hypothetical protein